LQIFVEIMLQLGLKHPNIDFNQIFVEICSSLGALNMPVCQINLRTQTAIGEHELR